MDSCASAMSDYEIVNPNQHVRNTFVDIRCSADVQGKRPQSDSELCKRSRQPALHPARGRSPSPYKELFGEKEIVEVSTSMDKFDEDGGARRRARPGRKERQQMRQNMRDEPFHPEQTCFDTTASPPTISPSTPFMSMWFLSFASAAMLLFVGKVCFDKFEQHQMAHADRLQREDSRNMEMGNQHRHELALQKPGADLLRDARDVIGTSVGWSLGLFQGNSVEKADAIISKLDYEKFQVSTGAWKFKCNASDVDRSVRAKLGAQGTQNRSGLLPEAEINNLIISLQTDDEVVEHKRDLVVDGGLGTSTSGAGLMYQYRLRSTVSNGKVSVALMVFSISFDMKKVVDHYETQEEPVYEFVPAPKSSKRTCTTRSTDGPHCVFPFVYRGQRFSRCTTEGCNALWCATSTYANDRMYSWGYCGPESCKEKEELGPKLMKKFVRMAQKKFPVYSHRALPQGVTQSDLIQALDVVASQEAVKVLSN